MKKLVLKLFNMAGYTVKKTGSTTYPDLDAEFKELYDRSKDFTMTSVERMYAVYAACKYISTNHIEGDMVECGVWKGGSSMMIALTLMKLNDTTRKIYLYDTYEGMSEPSDKDVSFKNEKMKEQWAHVSTTDKIYCYSTLDEVKRNILRTGYPEQNLIFIKGKVEESIPQTVPNKISLLRLDTDWYESTYHELKHLFPLLVKKGILILDDYGHWKGAREAADQYFKETRLQPLLNRIDYTGRMMVKSE